MPPFRPEALRLRCPSKLQTARKDRCFQTRLSRLNDLFETFGPSGGCMVCARPIAGLLLDFQKPDQQAVRNDKSV